MPLAAVTFRLMLALARNDGIAPESCISVLTLTGPAARGHEIPWNVSEPRGVEIVLGEHASAKCTVL